MPVLRQPSLAPIGFLVIALLGGCTADLAAIREFAEISTESAEYDRIVDDYVGHFERQRAFTPPARFEFLDEQTARRESQRAGLSALHTTVADYMDALGRLAADEVATFDSDVGELTGAVRNTNLLKPEEADAAGRVLSLIANAAVEEWRQSKLEEIIERGNAPLQSVLVSLTKVVKVSVADAKAEQQLIDSTYGDIIRETPSDNKAGIRALQEWNVLRLAEVEERKLATAAYIDVLMRISEGHQDLYDGRDDLSAKVLLAKMRRYAKDIRKTFNAVRKL